MSKYSHFAIAAAGLVALGCAKTDKGPSDMSTSHPQAAGVTPTNNGVSQLDNNNARASTTDTGPERHAANSGSPTSGSPGSLATPPRLPTDTAVGKATGSRTTTSGHPKRP